MIKSKEFQRKSIEDEGQTVEILGVAKFGNLQISQVGKFRNPQNFAEISQVANFRNLRTLLIPLPVDCFLIHLLVVLYKFALM